MTQSVLASADEIRRAIELWNQLSPVEVAERDPFNGLTGRSGAAAYNFLLLATAGRIWNQQMLDSALPKMKNFKSGLYDLSNNAGHIPRIVEHPTRYVELCGYRAVIRPDGQQRSVQINPKLARDPEFRRLYLTRYKYIGAANTLGEKDSIAKNGESTQEPEDSDRGIIPSKVQIDVESKLSGNVIDDLKQVLTDKQIKGTAKLALVEARLGQGKFRKQVLALWEGRCAVTGSCVVDALRASHIKPWCLCSDAERLDPENGLPLIATLDALFDRGLISFDDLGKILISESLPMAEIALLGLKGSKLSRDLGERSRQFLAHHRDRFRFG